MNARLPFLLVAFVAIGFAGSAGAQGHGPETTGNVTYFLAQPSVQALTESFTIVPGGETVLGALLVNDLDVEQTVDLQGVVYVSTGDERMLAAETDKVQTSLWPTRVTLGPGERTYLQLLVSVADDVPVGTRIVAGVLTESSGGHANLMQAVSQGQVVSPAPAGVPRDDVLLATGAGIATVAVAGAAVFALGVRRDPWALGTPLVALYSRLKRAEVLDQATRERVHRLVVERPGVRWSELKRLSGLGTGALLHHLALLERHGFLLSRKEGVKRRFFPAGLRLPEPEPFPLTPAQMRVLDALAEGGLTQRDVADRLGITQQGTSYHLKALERRGYVTVERRGADWTWRATQEAPKKAADARTPTGLPSAQVERT